ncbi:DinB family protein [Saccharopolyspora sp. HNM0983]|uniref:DinB family protein n=1 Tax=Saccharopolyspora montiporae TaxID=2781240 RepID=A0A929G1K6_9PSEU|nr:DinB family protein [Saccharopolyspora sp. HNM0983]MBE9374783.1 DinB family protein [Saccharopolyspora sp. HNM0983]
MGATRNTADEATDLLGALDTHRGFLRYAVRGLDDEQAGSHPTASELSLGGLIKHVTSVERGWMSFLREGAAALRPDETAMAARAAGFRMEPQETLDGLLADHERAAAETAQLIRSLPDLDEVRELPEAPWFEPGAGWSARRVLLHLLAETAQHAGHADILRETLDGQKTMG